MSPPGSSRVIFKNLVGLALVIKLPFKMLLERQKRHSKGFVLFVPAIVPRVKHNPLNLSKHKNNFY